jgi:hypothetical protein
VSASTESIDLLANVWAPIDTTYHRLAIDTPAIAMSICGLVVTSEERVVVEAQGIGTVCHPGVQCFACRLRTFHPDKVGVIEALS